LDAGGNINEEMTRQFEFIRDEIKVITGKQGDIQDTVSRICDMFGVKANNNDHTATINENDDESVSR
jgi:hypothetical protein